jgi:ABC-2 type transport system permease protein
VRPLLLIVQREVRERLQTKSFRIFTAGLFVLVLGAILALDRAPEIFGDISYELGVPGHVSPELVASLERFAAVDEVELTLRAYADETTARQWLADDDIDAYLADGVLTYSGSESTRLTAIVSNAVYVYELELRLDALGLTDEQRASLLAPQQLEVVQTEGETAGRGERQFIGFLSALALYVTIAVYGNWILTGIVEEKSTRVVEVLLGLVRPLELLAGKTLGILIVALVQLGTALAGAVLGLVLTGGGQLPSVALDVVLAAIPLYLLGLMIYSLLYAAAGATVSRQADAQAASTPIVMMLLVPYMFAAIFVPQNPDGLASTVLSIFPLTSPLVMPARVANGSPSVEELIACYALLVPAVALAAFVGGRIYAGAILSGRRLTFSRLLGAILKPGATG